MSIFPGWENPFFKIETLRSHAKERVKKTSAKEGIRTPELLRDQPLKLAPLTWLGYLRK